MAEIRRIVLAIDPALLQGRAPELAAGLAAAMSVEIEALLIEDAALLVAASLPFTRETLAPTGVSRDFSAEDLELGFAVLARRARSRFEALARPAGLRLTFRALRGNPVAELGEIATGHDLLVLGSAADGPLELGRMRSIAQRLARPVLFLGAAARTGMGRGTGVALLLEGAEFNGGTLEAAAALAARLSGELLILQRRPDPAQRQALVAAAAALPHDIRIVVAAAAPSDTAGSEQALAEAIGERVLLVVPERLDRPEAG